MSVPGIANIFCSLWFTILEIYYFSFSGFFEPVNSFISLTAERLQRTSLSSISFQIPWSLCFHCCCGKATVNWLWSVFFSFLFGCFYTLSFQYSAVSLQCALEWIFHLFSWVCFLHHGLTCLSVWTQIREVLDLILAFNTSKLLLYIFHLFVINHSITLNIKVNMGTRVK